MMAALMLWIGCMAAQPTFARSPDGVSQHHVLIGGQDQPSSSLEAVKTAEVVRIALI